MNQMEEDTFLTQAAKAAVEAEAAYYKRQVDQGNVGEPSHSNEVVVEDWYSDDELLTQYISDIFVMDIVLSYKTLPTRHGTHIPFSLVPQTWRDGQSNSK